jgi:hypothetical protein
MPITIITTGKRPFLFIPIYASTIDDHNGNSLKTQSRLILELFMNTKKSPEIETNSLSNTEVNP